jgi:multiple sugar transport system permease protein
MIVLFPIIWTILTSFKEKRMVYQIPPVVIFSPIFENYISLFSKYPFAQYFINSGIVALVTTFIGIIIGAAAAFSIARFNTGGDFIKKWVLNNRTMPTVVVLIPFFMIAQKLGAFDKYTSLIVAYLTFLLPFCIWMLIPFFEAIPKDMEEAALVDGANLYQTLFYIVLPISAPGIAATAILSFLYSWNEFLFALILTGKNTRTLPIGVANFMTQLGIEYGEMSAAVSLMIIPVIILTLSIRKHLVSGLSYGSIK